MASSVRTAAEQIGDAGVNVDTALMLPKSGTREEIPDS
jgi:hypothetical protein